MHQLTIEAPSEAMRKFDTDHISVYDIVRRYIQWQYAENKNYSLYTDDILNPRVFEGSAQENIDDLRQKYL